MGRYATHEVLNKIVPKNEAKRLFFLRHPVCDISRILSIPATTIYTWAEKGLWEQAETEDKIAFTIETKLLYLLNQDDWTGAEKQKIDFLQRQLENVRRTQAKYQYDKIEEAAKQERKVRRDARDSKSKNDATLEQINKMKEIFSSNLFDYQKKWHENINQRNRFILKSRQIGATYYFAREAIIDAFESGRNKIFISASRAQANIFKSYIVKFAFEVGIILKGGDTIYLENGAELHFLGTNYKTAQGLNGDLYLDEIFWIFGFAQLYKVATGMSSHKKWRRTLMSTPSTINHEAFQLWSGNAKNKPVNIEYDHLKDGYCDIDRQWRHIVPINDAIAGGCDLFDVDELKDEYSDQDFENLFNCKFIDDTLSVFSLSTMLSCHVDSWTEWTDIKPFNVRPYSGKTWIGYDPNGGGLGGDNAAVVVITAPKDHDDIIRIIEHKQFKNGEDFEAQSNYILKLCLKYSVSHIALDGNGVGAGVAQIVKKAKPSITKILIYTNTLKDTMIRKTKNVISKGRLKYDAGANDITQSFMSIKDVNGVYKTDRNNGCGHGDLAWSIMNAIENESIDRNSKSKSGFEVI